MLRVIKDALLDKELQAVEEYLDTDNEIRLPSQEYSFNDIKREIMAKPMNLPYQPIEPKKRCQNLDRLSDLDSPNKLDIQRSSLMGMHKI